MFNKDKLSWLSVWTLAVSLCLHTVLLSAAAFFVVSSAPPAPVASNSVSAKIQAVKKLIAAPRAFPKPRVRRPPVSSLASKTAGLFSDSPFTDTGSVAIVAQPNETPASLASIPSYELLSSFSASSTEFFGVESKEQNVCYVVDSSGSMQGIFSIVKNKLKESINNLRAEQYFGIVFFGDGAVRIFGQTQMLRASPEAKAKAIAFIDSVFPAGQTNVLDALKKAFMLKDSLGNPPTAIYLLTDGLDLAESSGSYYFSASLEKQRLRYCPKTIINTIGFWTNPSDWVILKDIAENSQGSFTLIAQPKTERYIEIE